MAFQPTPEIIDKYMPIFTMWMTKNSQMSQDYQDKYKAFMANQEQIAEGDKNFNENQFPTATDNGTHMNREQFSKLIKMMQDRADEKFGAHIEWTDAELD